MESRVKGQNVEESKPTRKTYKKEAQLKKYKLSAILESYEETRKSERSLFQALMDTFKEDAHISELRNFINNDLPQDPQHVLTPLQKTSLEIMLLWRFKDIHATPSSYRLKPNDLVNRTFVMLANFLDDKPRIQILIQAYKNDHALDNTLLANAPSEIFAAESRYVYLHSELKEHLEKTESLSFPPPKEDPIPMTKEDIKNLKEIPVFKQLIETIENKFAGYQNKYTLNNKLLCYYPKESFSKPLLFVTDDNQYCFLIKELLAELDKTGNYINPHTKKEFSPNDVERIKCLPELKDTKKLLSARQQELAELINNETIEKLKTLVEGMLTFTEVDVVFSDRMKKARAACQAFQQYFQKLSRTQQDALNEYWVDSYLPVGGILYFFQSSGAKKFSQLYQKMTTPQKQMEGAYMQQVAGSLIEMILQLAPYTKFNVMHPSANNFIDGIRAEHKHKPNSPYNSLKPKQDENEGQELESLGNNRPGKRNSLS